MRKTHYKTEWSKDRCFSILREYAEYCKTADFRERGNPPRVIHAVQCLKGMFETGRFCEECDHRVAYDVDLHHVDGNWRNYSFDNLVFLCSSHHHLSHVEEEIMEQIANRYQSNGKNRYQWQDKNGNPTDDTKNYAKEVEDYLAQNPDSPKEATYLKIGEKYGIRNSASVHRILRIAKGLPVRVGSRRAKGASKGNTGNVKMTREQFQTFLSEREVASKYGIELLP